MRSVGISLCVDVRLSLCPVRALTFESLGLETSFLYVSSDYLKKSSSYIKVIGSRSRSREPVTKYTRLFAVGPSGVFD